MIVFRIFKLVFLVYAADKAFNKFIDLLNRTVNAGRNIKR